MYLSPFQNLHLFLSNNKTINLYGKYFTQLWCNITKIKYFNNYLFVLMKKTKLCIILILTLQIQISVAQDVSIVNTKIISNSYVFTHQYIIKRF